MEDAIAVLAKLTKSVKDVTLPPTGNLSLNGETFAYHEEYYAHGAGRYQIPTRRSLANGANLKAADYVRARWKLELIRRTIDDAFHGFRRGGAAHAPPHSADRGRVD